MDALTSTGISQFDSFRLDLRRGELCRRDDRGNFVPVTIGSRAIEILGVLIGHPGDLISRAAIMESVWPGTVVEDSNLNVQVAALRRILDQGRSAESCIQTVAGRGYRFTAAVTRVETNASSDANAKSSAGPSLNYASEEQFPRKAAPTRASADGRWWFSKASAAALIAVAVIGLVVAANRLWFEGAGTPPRLSIVVLPFANLGNDPNQEYFVDAITDDLTTDLSRISGSFVIARSTAFTFKAKTIDVKQIGRELGVRYVLEGSVRPAGGQDSDQRATDRCAKRRPCVGRPVRDRSRKSRSSANRDHRPFGPDPARRTYRGGRSPDRARKNR